MIVFGAITPHPPIIVPAVGHGEEKKAVKTVEGLNKLAGQLALTEPDTLVIISPHMVHYPHLFNVCGMSDLYGSFSHFREGEYEWHGQNNMIMAREIVDKAEDEGLPAILYDNGEAEYELDHGVMVPLYFMLEKLDFPCKVLPLGYSFASRAEHYAFGQSLAQVCERKGDERIAIIASGDLSHRLKHGAPTGFSEDAKKFDELIVSLIKKGDEYSIINIDEERLERAGECGYRSILILLGALSGRDYKPDVYSYEGPFGVGYMVANMNIK